ncbi:MAG: TrkH family potassium uptake protein [Planctomycetota bacterium]
MNFRLVCRLLGMIAWLIGLTMAFSLVWALPSVNETGSFEARGFWALLSSMVLCFATGYGLRSVGRDAPDAIYRKEAMAVVGLSWVLATVLGAMPYLLGGVVYRAEGGKDIRMGVSDALFESQSGFSTTGATVLTDIENPAWVPQCILFWRSSTHFLGGLGIIVLFVAVLGQGSAGKALMRAEMPGPSKEGSQERMQHTAWNFAAIYCGLNAVLTVLLWLEGMTVFEALCHSFGTMATGGFSTLNASLGGFDGRVENYRLIEYTVIVFMVLAGTNFTLLYLTLIGRPVTLLRDLEWRTYALIIVASSAVIVVLGLWVHSDFADGETAFRDSLFQVTSILTTTGFGTADFDQWHNFSRALLLVLMSVGGCAGSTGGGMKVIRHVLCVKVLHREIERAFHPAVVRHVRLGGEAITDNDLPRSILVYFGLIALLFTLSWLVLVAIEPDATWSGAGHDPQNKLVDSASAVAATLHNIGPGLGIVGATQNYAPFSTLSKLLFTFLMMLGRLELFPVLVLLVPGFWRDR